MKLTCSGPMTQRLTLAGVCAYMLAATTVFLLHRQYMMPSSSVHVSSHALKHAACSYQTNVFAKQYEALYAISASPPASLQALRRISDPLAPRSWADCLPMHTVVCGVAAGAQDSLFTQSPPCRSAAVHHLLVAASAAMEERGHTALPIGSGLQHIWEHGALLPDATSIDMLTDASSDLAAWFWTRGFAHFTVDDQLRIGSQTEHTYRRAQLTPLSCLPLYGASIAAPAHPATFFTAAQGMRHHDDLDVWYPNANCEALCDDDIPPFRRDVKFEVAHCPLRNDTEYNARLAKYVDRPLPLQLDEAHLPYIAPFSNTTKLREGKAWEYCLPMKPQQCGARRGLKTTLFETPQGKPCRSAVLQLLLENMLEVVEELSLPSFVYFGTLLGAWRDEAIIPHTPDIDIVLPLTTDWAKVQDAMWARGFYVFKRDIHGACVASHHPLASLLYAPKTDLVEVSTYNHGTPYLDLYSWSKEVGRKVKVETALEKLDVAHMFPLTCHETIFGNHVPGIQFPEAMFRSEYGTTYASDPDLHLTSCESYCDYQLLDTNE
ncbi:hypothetical protein SPRG_12773 [Saprolegnia parasitica CBS 223.65]|uniref:Uncharacterized protein n=1 Tax=Saprolegnia parasitica (strain CBS 223.65) TaxID=695850 RepID=A0A067C6Z6_SAPPC|nr:hypothetical protein SPRG_12773 [Saprolegnia parasitica CBS 223.65]KDO22311.1 hypothetical protein SPRG_12773 [Saprolegnia parasitica CBS 223.65]|eukprot:XP_012206947.1 hypothetical protein SPRG_12773 [Saprolegnia parasitica CBS 223.65]